MYYYHLNIFLIVFVVLSFFPFCCCCYWCLNNTNWINENKLLKNTTKFSVSFLFSCSFLLYVVHFLGSPLVQFLWSLKQNAPGASPVKAAYALLLIWAWISASISVVGVCPQTNWLGGLIETRAGELLVVWELSPWSGALMPIISLLHMYCL